MDTAMKWSVIALLCVSCSAEALPADGARSDDVADDGGDASVDVTRDVVYTSDPMRLSGLYRGSSHPTIVEFEPMGLDYHDYINVEGSDDIAVEVESTPDGGIRLSYPDSPCEIYVLSWNGEAFDLPAQITEPCIPSMVASRYRTTGDGSTLWIDGLFEESFTIPNVGPARYVARVLAEFHRQ